ncbi:MAG: hypothetical protein MK364_16105, partial [Pirellulales bacterium]|nr:hypothetical protein [Pirellulales bacterium]
RCAVAGVRLRDQSPGVNVRVYYDPGRSETPEEPPCIAGDISFADQRLEIRKRRPLELVSDLLVVSLSCGCDSR